MSLAELLQLGDHELVSVVGGGGKSTLLFALGDELAAAGHGVVLTTTTKMGREQTDGAATVCWSADPKRVVAAIKEASPVMVVTGGDDHKVTGPEPDVVDRLFAESGAAYVIVEADGSRGRPLKAPAPHEPVIPEATTLVVILMGIESVGAPLRDVSHRVEQAVAFTGLSPDDRLSAADCARIITHPEGTMRSVPAGARVVVGLTKVGARADRTTGELQTLLTAHPRISQVVVIPRL